jgi:hypothetical protein
VNKGAASLSLSPAVRPAEHTDGAPFKPCLQVAEESVRARLSFRSRTSQSERGYVVPGRN